LAGLLDLLHCVVQVAFIVPDVAKHNFRAPFLSVVVEFSLFQVQLVRVLAQSHPQVSELAQVRVVENLDVVCQCVVGQQRHLGIVQHYCVLEHRLQPGEGQLYLIEPLLLRMESAVLMSEVKVGFLYIVLHIYVLYKSTLVCPCFY
jgi:hypothetical protein